MAKAKIKAKKNIPEGMTLKDLSFEKRRELFIEKFTEFNKTQDTDLGVSIGLEIAWTKQAAVPRMVLVDLLTKENENEKQQTEDSKEVEKK